MGLRKKVSFGLGENLIFGIGGKVGDEEEIKDETDVIKPLWFHKDELPKGHMWPDNLEWLPKLLDGNKIDGVFLSGDNKEPVLIEIVNAIC